MIVFDYALGETIVIELDAESVDPSVVALSAAMRRLNHDRSDFRDDAPSIPMAITPRAAAGGFPAGWHTVLDAVTAAALEPGYYGAMAWFNSAGGKFAAKMVVLKLMRAAGA